jgi:hypothetical protein
MRESKIHVLTTGKQYRSRPGEYCSGTFVMEKGHAWNGGSWAEVGSKLVLRGRACHGKIGKMGGEQCLEAIPFAVLRLKTGRKGPNFDQARSFAHWNARKSRGVLILTGNLGAQKIAGRRGEIGPGIG